MLVTPPAGVNTFQPVVEPSNDPAVSRFGDGEAPVDSTQPFAALLHSGWTANRPVAVVMFDRLVHAHLSPISLPPASIQALSSGSVIASANSWPSTMLTPSNRPLPPLTELRPHAVPASVMYGRFVYVTLRSAATTPWYAQNCVPKPAIE